MIRQLLLIIFILSTVGSLIAQSTKRPKVGLVLSGGGAKGLAHIGVLKVLEEEGIYPDYITGTSMGSVVGGLYAIGYRASDLEKLAKELNWTEYFTDVFDRSFFPIEIKSDVERYLLSFEWRDGQVKLPTGFVDGQNLALLLSQLTMPVHHIQDFDDFKIPFRCVGADVETGQAVVFSEGDLADAIRCSIGIPTVFEPFDKDSTLIVDGGVIRNLPVQDALDMGANVTVAVDVGAPLYTREELTSILSILSQTSSYRIVEKNAEQLALADLVIVPDNINDFSFLNFNALDSLIAVGERAARRAIPELRRLLNKYDKKVPIGVDETAISPADLRINTVEIRGVDRQAATSFLNILQLKPPRTLSHARLDKKIKRVIATGFFEKTYYRLLPEGDGHRLVVFTREVDKNLLRLSANYDSDLNAGLLLNATLRNIGVRSSLLSVDFRLSENPALLTDFRLYTKTRPNIGLRMRGLMHFYRAYFYNDYELMDEFRYRHAAVRLDLFSGIRRDLSLSVGGTAEYVSQSRRFFDIETNDVDILQVRSHIELAYETFNRKHFPTRGTRLSLWTDITLAGDMRIDFGQKETRGQQFNRYAMLDFSQIFRLHSRWTLRWNNRAGIAWLDSAPEFNNLFYLGRAIPYESRFVDFTGLALMELPVDRYAFTGLRLQVEPLLDKYISVDYNVGYARQPEFSILEEDGLVTLEEWEDLLSGIGLELGAYTAIGPISLRGEYNFISTNLNFIFHLGYVF